MASQICLKRSSVQKHAQTTGLASQSCTYDAQTNAICSKFKNGTVGKMNPLNLYVSKQQLTARSTHVLYDTLPTEC